MKATLKIDDKEVEVEISEEELDKLKLAREVNYVGLKRVKDLHKKLTEFAVEHRVKELDWGNSMQDKYYIYYNHYRNKAEISSIWEDEEFGQIYFDRVRTAELAIEEFKDELEWYFTEFKDKLGE